MALEDFNMNYIIPVSVNGKTVNVFFDTDTPRSKKFMQGMDEIHKKNKRDWADKAEMLAWESYACNRYTEMLSEYSPELKKALNGNIVDRPESWTAFLKAWCDCQRAVMSHPFSGKPYKFNGVVELI